MIQVGLLTLRPAVQWPPLPIFRHCPFRSAWEMQGLQGRQGFPSEMAELSMMKQNSEPIFTLPYRLAACYR